MKIAGFHNEFRFLSNFWPAPIQVDGKWFPTVEHAYQAMKTADKDEWERIRMLETPGLAKKAGKKLVIRENWDKLKIPTMRMLLQKKFRIPELREALLLTHPLELEETNTWWDRFWGVCQGVGENHLGKLLMQIREEIHYGQR